MENQILAAQQKLYDLRVKVLENREVTTIEEMFALIMNNFEELFIEMELRKQPKQGFFPLSPKPLTKDDLSNYS